MKFKVTLGKSKRALELEARSMSELEMLIASDLPEEYYGMSIVAVDAQMFTCIPVKEYFEGSNKTPLELATNALLSGARLNCGAKDYDAQDNSFFAIPLSEAIKKGRITDLTLKEHCEDIRLALERRNISADVELIGNRVCVTIDDGDWKHDHLAAKNLISSMFPECMIESKTFGDDGGDDCYSANHFVTGGNCKIW